MTVVGLIIAYGVLAVSMFLGKRNPYREKLNPYESGVKPGRWNWKTNVQYYLIALAFLVFDIEVVFMYPWAVKLMDLKMFAFIEMLIFILILLIGYVYIWRKGGLEWQ